LISSDYREQNKRLHEVRNDYGGGGSKHAENITGLCQMTGGQSVLDYGCGKGSLRRALLGSGLTVTEYDPAIEGKDDPPEPADVVACTDVLEHVEPECLEAVLDDLRRVTRIAVFLEVATRPAVKTLPDGRNAHLIVQSYKWWLPRIWSRFEIVTASITPKAFVVVGR